MTDSVMHVQVTLLRSHTTENVNSLNNSVNYVNKNDFLIDGTFTVSFLEGQIMPTPLTIHLIVSTTMTP